MRAKIADAYEARVDKYDKYVAAFDVRSIRIICHVHVLSH